IDPQVTKGSGERLRDAQHLVQQRRPGDRRGAGGLSQAHKRSDTPVRQVDVLCRTLPPPSHVLDEHERLGPVARVEHVALVIIRRQTVAQQRLFEEDLRPDGLVVLFPITRGEIRREPFPGQPSQRLRVLALLSLNDPDLAGAVIGLHHKRRRQTLEGIGADLFTHQVNRHQVPFAYRRGDITRHGDLVRQVRIDRAGIAHPVEDLFGEQTGGPEITETPVVLPVAGPVEDEIRRALDQRIQRAAQPQHAHPGTSWPRPRLAWPCREQAIRVAPISTRLSSAPARLKAATATRSLAKTKKPTYIAATRMITLTTS